MPTKSIGTSGSRTMSMFALAGCPTPKTKKSKPTKPAVKKVEAKKPAPKAVKKIQPVISPLAKPAPKAAKKPTAKPLKKRATAPDFGAKPVSNPRREGFIKKQEKHIEKVLRPKLPVGLRLVTLATVLNPLQMQPLKNGQIVFAKVRGEATVRQVRVLIPTSGKNKGEVEFGYPPGYGHNGARFLPTNLEFVVVERDKSALVW